MTDGSTAPVRRRPSRSDPWLLGVHVLVVVSVVVLNLFQQTGRITFDTKLDLQLDPADLLARSSSLWNGDWALGGLQNQASGYLFPMGPAFLAGELLGVPMWIWQRLWSALVMLLAYEGARRLAASWPGIGRAGAILAGLTYMLAPRVLTTVGGLSGETLPAAVLPWTVLPLVLYLRGRMRGWVAFVLSAATIPWMGGQNATLVVACLVLPALLLALASGRALRRRLTDLVGWGALVGVATTWWVVPLLLMGAYSPLFLDFIESSKDTAGSVGWLASLRGTSHWVAFFPGGGQVGWTGGYELSSSSWLLLTTVLVAAIGLAGLLRRELWQRRALVTAVLLGLVVLSAGRGGWAGSVLSDAWLHALDTFLAPLRNIHKFDPLVRLPLALGVGAWVTHAMPQRWPASWRAVARVPVHVAVLGATVALVAGTTVPALGGLMRVDRGFEDVPGTWRDAVAYLDDQAGPTRTLVLPGAGFAVQTWGRTIDEPIQVLDPSPWLARAQVTVAPAGTLRLLDSVEQSMSRARPQERTADALRTMGITHVVVRNDLDPATDAPEAAVVRASMADLPGARVAATFGRAPDGGPLLEVFELDQAHDPRVEVQDWEDRVVVSGGPEVVPDLRSAGVVGDGRAVVLAAGDRADVDLPLDVVTDSLRRVERNFGRVHDASSGVMTSADDYRIDRLVHDYIDDALPMGRTVAVYDGAADIVASTSGGYANALGAVRPEEHPYAAFDRSIFTGWSSSPFSRPVEQWVELRFDEPTDVREVSLVFDNAAGVDVTSVRVSTDERSVDAAVAGDGTVAGIDVDDTAATSLRVAVLDAGADRGRVRLMDVRIAGHDVTRSLLLPGTVSADTSVFVSSEPLRRACAVTDEGGAVACDRSRFRESSETPGFDRTITVGESGSWSLLGRAVATYGSALDRLFAPLDPSLLDVTSSSTYGGDPAVNAAAAVDGRPETGWASAPGDPAPALQVSWGPRRRVSAITLTAAQGLPGGLPDLVTVDPGRRAGEPQLVATTGLGAGRMRTVRTNRLKITAVGEAAADGFAVSELTVSRTGDLRDEPSPDTRTGTLCGFGPTVEVAGQVVQTRLRGTLEDVRRGAELAVLPCDGVTVDLEPGAHRVRVTNPSGFAVSDLTLTPTTEVPSEAGEPSPPAEVRSWTPTQRRVAVEVGPESVLAVSESYNRGWTARLDGSVLEPVVLEGWQQGFVVPAGAGGEVVLTYAPQVTFGAALVGGLVLVGVLQVLAGVLLLRRRRGGPAPAQGDTDPADRSTVEARDGARRTSSRAVLEVVSVLVLAVISLPLAVGTGVGRLTARVRSRRMALACAAVLVLAALVAVSASSVVIPPAGADVLAALAVGVVCGRVLLAPRDQADD
ncbi:alpha-(1-_3)-arabinofuranosyltransferase domain-containing protein [Nocardioides renjunii]|uniref:alpha-(1->3)-arabinofuranosyltransferase domain-containing protein n=1 Tax=Nocardioides renjunii TaxID=3095075 RepID=UPI002AFF7D60|nr:alpha-(1->3)-arabinofuranosyltransferase family protein [Nocardioides sp. S-34]WQQ24140.1 alpha-(1->3)-arabinofuranosyltransferase family protein [Nocardioides sp. S-34]